MATLTIKNIPDELCQRLKERAAEHHRSVNGEVIFCLEKVLVGNRVDPDEFLERVRALRRRMPRVFVTDKDLRAAKNLGPP
jgi:antitoxin FitA